MKLGVYIVVFVLVSVQASRIRHGGRTDRALRLLNGRNDTTGKYPYVVLILGWGRQRICSGSLLTQHWVLTAAHCCLRVYGADYINYGNIADLAIVGETCSQIALKIMHPRFDGTLALTRGISRVNDIGLMNVFPEVPMPKYGKLSAVDYKTLIGVSIEIAGYGISDFKDMNWDPDIVDHRPLQIGDGIVTPCSQLWKIHNLYKGYVCMAPKCSNIQIPLTGDSGGPLFYDDKIIAVVSQGEPTQLETYSTPVSPYLTWIHREITSRY